MQRGLREGGVGGSRWRGLFLSKLGAGPHLGFLGFGARAGAFLGRGTEKRSEDNNSSGSMIDSV